jgi:enoyl-CoA hydratase/carnithine racemase
MPAQLITRREGPVAWMVFSNLERHNAVTYEMWCEVPERIREFDADPSVRVIALTGDGEKAFVSGADISEFEKKRGSADAAAVYNVAVDAAYAAVQAAQKPTLARVKGICMGGGLWLALSCDLRICNDTARFAMPAAKLGLGIRYESVRRMMCVAPPLHVADVLFTGRQFDGREALRLGLVNRSAPDEELDAVCGDYLSKLGVTAPLAVRAMKESMRAFQSGERPADIEGVRKLVEACYASEDYKEGRKAFAEKRTPVFNGR